MYNLSVVNIAPDAHKDNINTIAEILGCGQDNLSIKLVKENGDIYWGCHAWWRQEDYFLFSDPEFRKTVISDELEASIPFLYGRKVLDGNPHENWAAALLECNLTMYSEESDEDQQIPSNN